MEIVQNAFVTSLHLPTHEHVWRDWTIGHWNACVGVPRDDVYRAVCGCLFDHVCKSQQSIVWSALSLKVLYKNSLLHYFYKLCSALEWAIIEYKIIPRACKLFIRCSELRCDLCDFKPFWNRLDSYIVRKLKQTVETLTADMFDHWCRVQCNFLCFILLMPLSWYHTDIK